MSDNKPRSIKKAEALREIGVLACIFGPLDSTMATSMVTWQRWAIAIGSVVAGWLLIEFTINQEEKYYDRIRGSDGSGRPGGNFPS